MRKVLGLGLSAAAVIATGLIPTAAGAAVTATGPDVDTTVTFAVTSGALTLTAPDTADLGTGAPGTAIVGQLGDGYGDRQPGRARRHLERERVVDRLHHRSRRDG